MDNIHLPLSNVALQKFLTYYSKHHTLFPVVVIVCGDITFKFRIYSRYGSNLNGDNNALLKHIVKHVKIKSYNNIKFETIQELIDILYKKYGNTIYDKERQGVWPYAKWDIPVFKWLRIFNELAKMATNTYFETATFKNFKLL